jgi:transposase
MVGIIVTTPAGRKIELFLRTIAGSLTSEETIRFLKELKRHLGGRKLLLIWDGLPVHRSKIVSRYLVKQQAWLRIERFPAYAPELNPIEYCWSAMKQKHLGNLRAEGMSSLGRAVRRAKRTMNDRALLHGFLKASELY